jgi:hypothetical protein
MTGSDDGRQKQDRNINSKIKCSFHEICIKISPKLKHKLLEFKNLTKV